MKTQYYTATSLDGFIATEEDSLDWLFPLGDVNNSSYPAFIADVGALAMGSSTYEWMLRNAEMVAAEVGSPWPYTQPAWVFTSRKLPEIAGATYEENVEDARSLAELFELIRKVRVPVIAAVQGRALAGSVASWREYARQDSNL